MTWVSPLPALPDGRRPVVSSGFGPRAGRLHAGLDIAYRAAPGDPAWPGKATVERTKSYYSPPQPVRSVLPGTVIESRQPGWNNRIRGRVRVRHPDGSATVYYHLEEVTAREGDSVQAGDKLGTSGPAGDYPFRHLHLELYPPGVVHKQGNQINPQPYLTGATLGPEKAPAPASRVVVIPPLFKRGNMASSAMLPLLAIGLLLLAGR